MSWCSAAAPQVLLLPLLLPAAGAHTLLAEQNGFLGGTSTASLVTPMMANHLQAQPLNQGIYLEVLNTLLETGDAAVYKDGNAGWFNPEMLKLVLEQKAVAAGVELLYHVYFSQALVEAGVLKGAIFETKSGRGLIRAKVLIDASGDADLAFQAGGADGNWTRERSGQSAHGPAL
jgi:glycine/D-amino acid oxidase-like deaminating enzyme